MRGAWLLLWAALLFNAPMATARAADETRVLVAIDGDEALARRIVAELQALGLAAEAVRTPQPTVLDTLWKLTRERHSAALIWLEPSATQTRIWVLDRVTAKALRRMLNTPSDPLERDAIVATRAVELLRASLLELQQTPAPRGEVAASAPVAALLPTRSAMGVELGAALVGHPQVQERWRSCALEREFTLRKGFTSRSRVCRHFI